MIADIARMFGVTRQAVDLWSRNDASFPAPVDTVTAGRIWRTTDIVSWSEKRGRALAPHPGPDAMTALASVWDVPGDNT